MRLVTAEEMRAADQAAINDFGIPSIVLMENAGRAVVDKAEQLLDGVRGKKIAIFCGGGNNGGDGLVAARHLFNRGAEVRLYYLTDPEIFRGDALVNYQILQKMGVSGLWLTEGSRLNVAKMALFSADLAIDAIFGTGLNDDVRDIAASVIAMLNESDVPVISCDIPSGLSSSTGQPLGDAVKATATVTFALPKLGLVMPAAAPYVGELKVADISMPPQIEETLDSRRELIDIDFCRRWLKPRAREAYKGDFGHVLLVAGSATMPGAAILAGRGALKMGAGKLTAALPPDCRVSFTTRLPEAMLLNVEAAPDGGFSSAGVNMICNFAASSVLIGPGMGREQTTVDFIRELIPRLDLPLVLDADALFAVCGALRLLRNYQKPLVITPHAGEMAKLLGVSAEDVQANRIEAAEGFARQTDTVVVLKGAGTVIATPEGRIFINDTGNPGMATGGSGDVLAGMVATLLGQGLNAAAAAACAVWLHGHAGDVAAGGVLEAGMVAGDIAEALPYALSDVAGA
ncbi:MAG: NAD(P)H-hydrate dehydratase [Bacillota bacterium]|nr:NAD(P)H-hydrate dehydratase [Bacillota bacterium]